MFENRGIVALILVITSLVWLGAGFSILGLLIIAPMLFDAPGAAQQTAAWIMLGGIIAAPIIAVGMVVTAWLLYRRERYRAAVLLLGLPLVVAPILAVCGGMVAGALSAG